VVASGSGTLTIRITTPRVSRENVMRVVSHSPATDDEVEVWSEATPRAEDVRVIVVV